MAADWNLPLTRPLVLKSGEVLRTLHDVADLFSRRFSTVIESAPLEHALELLLTAAETGEGGPQGSDRSGPDRLEGRAAAVKPRPLATVTVEQTDEGSVAV